jgi:hypothetical protein
MTREWQMGLSRPNDKRQNPANALNASALITLIARWREPWQARDMYRRISADF